MPPSEKKRAAVGVRRTRVAATLTAVATAALLAACGSSHSGSAKSTGGASAATGSSGSASASSSSSATVVVGKVSGYGAVLTTPSGQPLYILSTDPSGSTKCTGACAKTWKPLTVSGSASAGSGASSSLVSTFKRSGPSGTQVLYAKHALYTHAGSAASAAGTASDGGVWYLINAKGAAVKSTTAGGY